MTTGPESSGTEWCTIEATVVSGFETVAAREIEDKLGVVPRPLYDDYDSFKGHLFFRLRESAVPTLSRLQTVDNIYVLAAPRSEPPDSPSVDDVARLPLPVDDVVASLHLLRRLPAKLDWKKVFGVWRRMFPERLVDYELPVASEAEMEAFIAAEPEDEWRCNVSWINPRLEKNASSKSGRKKKKKKRGAESDDAAEENEAGEREVKWTAEEGNLEGMTEERVEIDEENLVDVENGEKAAVTNESAAMKPSRDRAPTLTIPVAQTEPCAATADSTKCETFAKIKMPGVPTFRATCNRGQPSGEKHAFTSQDAAKVFGGAIQSFFQWNVDMTYFDVEVVLNISGDLVWVTLALTRESLHRRHIKHFGPTTLRSTIAMNLLKFSGLGDGETFCDPLCGGGGIPIEAAYEWPNALVIAGDSHEQAFKRAVDNVQYNNAKIRESSPSSPSSALRISVFRWDATVLPLRSEVVDVFVTDLPFGKRSGSKLENRILYPKLLNEFARVAKLNTGRAVFLTEDKNDFFKAFEANQSLWWKKGHLWINIGGMWAGVFLLLRNQRPWKPLAPSKNSLKQSAKKKRKMEAAAAAIAASSINDAVASKITAEAEPLIAVSTDNASDGLD